MIVTMGEPVCPRCGSESWSKRQGDWYRCIICKKNYRFSTNDPLAGGWRERLEELKNLPIGWDGYDGVPIKPEVAVMVEWLVELIASEPALIPGGDGSVQIEWHRDGYDIEINTDHHTPYLRSEA